ncbi:MAG: PadR family transcriptional regulator [Anaerolineales bacterium]|nr:PadR family transcriptional regulator [Anaerolineales bacterium]
MKSRCEQSKLEKIHTWYILVSPKYALEDLLTVKHALLALLDKDESYGYQLHGLMESALGDPWSINIGQVYSTLSRLERDGFVEKLPEAELAHDDRTVYSITRRGKSELRRWFREPLSRDDRLRDDVYAKLALSRISRSVSPGEVIQAQRRQLLKELHQLTQLRSSADGPNELPYILLLESAIMHLEADLKWLDLCEQKLEELDATPSPYFESRPRGRPPKDDGSASGA